MGAWLRKHKLGHLEAAFYDELIDGETLLRIKVCSRFALILTWQL